MKNQFLFDFELLIFLINYHNLNVIFTRFSDGPKDCLSLKVDSVLKVI